MKRPILDEADRFILHRKYDCTYYHKLVLQINIWKFKREFARLYRTPINNIVNLLANLLSFNKKAKPYTERYVYPKK